MHRILSAMRVAIAAAVVAAAAFSCASARGEEGALLDPPTPAPDATYTISSATPTRPGQTVQATDAATAVCLRRSCA
jgi:negative regulator of sigma E activity